MEEKKNRALENEREETASALTRLQCCPDPSGFLCLHNFFPSPLLFPPPLYRFHPCCSPRTRTPTIWDALARPLNYPPASGENNGTPTPFACVTLSYSIPGDSPLGGAHITCRAGPILQRSHGRSGITLSDHTNPQRESGPLMLPRRRVTPLAPVTHRPRD